MDGGQPQRQESSVLDCYSHSFCALGSATTSTILAALPGSLLVLSAIAAVSLIPLSLLCGVLRTELQRHLHLSPSPPGAKPSLGLMSPSPCLTTSFHDADPPLTTRISIVSSPLATKA